MSRTDNAIRDQAYQFFEQEAIELLQVLEDGLLTLRTQFEMPQVHQLMRAAHSIKGGAASVGLPGIQKIAHRLEDVLRALYRREDPIDADLEGALLQAYDCLRRPLQDQIERGHFDDVVAWEQAEPIFSFLETVLAKDLGADIELPSAAELGIDIVSEVFTGDVQRSLEHLESLLQSQTNTQVIVGELRASAEVLAGIGELLGLPGFAAIAFTISQALDANPQMAIQIGRLAINDLHQAQELVLGGDREQGGDPSTALLELIHPLPTHNAPDASPPFPSDIGLGSSITDPTLSLDPTFDIDHAALGALEDLFGQSDPMADTGLLDLDAAYSELETLFNPTTATFTPHNDEVDTSHWSVAPDALSPDTESALAEALPVSPPEMIQASPPPAERPVEDPSTAIQDRETTAKPTAAAHAAAGQMEGSVRVDFLRLERLNNLVGELVTQENGSFLQTQQLQSKLKVLQQRFATFEQLSKTLQTWMDESLKTGIGQPKAELWQTTATPSTPSEIASLAEFDPLQMDSYSVLYTMMQDALEEIAQMGETMGDMTLLTQQAQQTQRRKQQTLKQVRNDLLWARMMPIGDILRRFPRMVRDLAAQQQKKVVFKQTGATTLVDKAILERLYDPLVHLIRNAFDHGTETPEERQAKGKPPEATIEIRAYHRGNQTFIELRDDGRGIDPEKVRASAISQNVLTSQAAAAATPEQLYQCLFESSFSTKDTVSELSGRGMGLSAVQIQVQAIKGKVSVNSQLGQGTTFTICLPLTLTIAKLLVFSVDSYFMAIPVDTLLAIVSADETDISTVQGRQFYRYQGRLIPLYPPSAFSHHYPLPKGLSERRPAIPIAQADKVPLLLIANGDDILALEVDHVFDELELVIKPFSAIAKAPSYLYGCAILGDGSLVSVIDGSVLIRNWLHTPTPAPVTTAPTSGVKVAVRNSSIPTILVVDDSLTARQTLTLTLQKYGYQVIQAADGREALDKLRQEPNIQGVFCDVEMPNMNGFEFLSASRKDYAATALPIVMLTSRSGDKHRGIAKLLGANQYLTKPYLEQELIQTLQTCLEDVKC